MIRYRQYRPAFFEGFVNEEGTVETLAELLALEFVQNFARYNFTRFSLSDERMTPASPINLMAEYRDGKEWWVVALLWPDGELDLPKWEPVYE